jgi:hypothetical protein
MKAAVDRAREAGDTVGGAFEVVAHNVPAGLGSHVHWDRKLDGLLAQALMSIPAIKAVGIGLGPAVGQRPGSAVHDEIISATGQASGTLASISRPTNRAGGLEGGCHEWRGRARQRVDEAHFDADEGPYDRRPFDGASSPPPRSSAAMSAPCPPPLSSARPLCRSSWRPRCWRSSVATRSATSMPHGVTIRQGSRTA